MQIQIISAKPEQRPAKSGNKTYSVLNLAYKNLQTGKVEGKNIMGFGATEGAYKVLSQAQTDDIFQIETTKNSNGYWDWVSAAKTAGSASAVPQGRSTSGSVNASPKSTYETPEERAKKQIYIVRQSSISNALSLLSVGAKAPPKVDEVISIARKFEDYVFGSDVSTDLPGPLADFTDVDDDIPL